MSKQNKKILGLLVTVMLVAFSFTSAFQSLASLPNEVRMFTSTVKQMSLPIPASVTASDSKVLELNGDIPDLSLAENFTIKPKAEGKSTLTFKLLGVIPFKSVTFDVLKDIKVVPGGQTIGVKLKSVGVMVVGHHSIQQKDGFSISPGEKAGLKIGDIILKMNDEKVSSVSDIVSKISNIKDDNEKVQLEVLRGKERLSLELKPSFDTKSKAYRLGIYIRDSAAGVGTLTFYDPNSNLFGALGHVITDVDTQTPIVVEDGKILHSSVTSIDKGTSGKPGGKRAIILDENEILGSITKNTPFGVFGKLLEKPKNAYSDKAIPIALPEEVKEGPAEILTVIEDQKVEKFNIEIVNVIEQKYPATKGMIIKVTDPRLLEKTGGIVQGMSGSPIIQNGKLVGAVTHVFVNEPTSGYGSFIEWMIKDAEIYTDHLKAS